MTPQDKVELMSAKVMDLPRNGASAAAPFNYSGGTAALPSRDVQHAWFELTRARPWKSLALVPVQDRTSTWELACEMAQMAALDPRQRVLLVNASGIAGDPLPAAAKGPAIGAPGAPPPAAGNGGAVPSPHGKYWVLDCAALNMDEAQVGMVEVPRVTDQLRAGTGPYTLILVATGSLLSRPAMVSSARSVDTAVVCVALGHTSFTDTKRTVELIGEENVVGTLALRSRR
jgi:hypothetical protein